jgi:DNA (cytosine-5)-methyltransferase 1
LLDLGLTMAGVRHEWFVEAEPSRREILGARWPGVPVFDDVRTAGAEQLERVGLIVGGFPCKGASNAGSRTGFGHPETALWAEFARIVGELRPRYVAVENVAAIRGLHGGAVWGTVLGDLAALGYDVAWGCVRASDVGAPHGRDRVFAVARLADSDGARWPERWQPEHPEQERERYVVDEDAAEASADAGRRGRHEGGPQQDDAGRGLRVGREAAPDASGGGRPGEGRRRELEPDERAVGADREAAADADQPRREELHGAAFAGRSQFAGALITQHVAVEWGEYEPAIRRWEAIHGPAPAPLTRVRGMDDGDAKMQRVRARLDRQRLSALGDGVHVYVGRLLGDAIMTLAREDGHA